MAKAMGNVIIEVDIAMTAGETAILGESKKVKALNGLCQEMGDQIRELIENKKQHIQGMVNFQETLISKGAVGKDC
ncbi:MAG: hypothetical protein LBI53_04855 [Candidatus Peribacteria bacterium]|jgi:hypothetical protein|nr:hypothetical protein [Candidatus Peribacteria bacterium]